MNSLSDELRIELIFKDAQIEELEELNKEMLEALIMIYKVWHEDSILISSAKTIIEKATGLKIEEVIK